MSRCSRVSICGAVSSKKIAFGFVLLLFALWMERTPCFAAVDKEEKLLQGADRSLWFEKARERQDRITGLQASVVQRKRHPSLRGEVVTEGTLVYRKPDFLRWEVVRPDPVIIVVDGRTMTTYYPSRKEAEKKFLADSPFSRGAMDFLVSGLSLSLTELERRFQVDLFHGEGYFLLKLVPKGRWLSRSVASISIYNEEEGMTLRRVVFEGTGGERTETIFSNMVLNPTLPPDAFDLRLGPDVRWVESGETEKARVDGP